MHPRFSIRSERLFCRPRWPMKIFIRSLRRSAHYGSTLTTKETCPNFKTIRTNSEKPETRYYHSPVHLSFFSQYVKFQQKLQKATHGSANELVFISQSPGIVYACFLSRVIYQRLFAVGLVSIVIQRLP